MVKKLLNVAFWIAVGIVTWTQVFKYLDRLTAPDITIEIKRPYWEEPEHPHWDIRELERVKEI